MNDVVSIGPRPRSGWSSLTRGVHVRPDADAVQRLRAWQFALPFWSSFTSLTAAQVRGWWLPPLPASLPMFVASGRSARISRPGVDVCRHNVLPPWGLVHGVRVPSPAETVLACARDLELLDVVLIGDAALHSGDVTREDLIVTSRLRRRGSPLLRRAIPLMDGRAESIFEGLLRILHVACGIEVEPQHLIVAEDGTVIGRADLLVCGTRMLHEFDGGHHRSTVQQRDDLRRHRRLLAAGYQRRGFTAPDVLLVPLGVLRDADASLGRVHDPGRIKVWYSLLQESLFTASGRRRLERRLGLSAETADETAR
jgi:very-short-patch-repair endonuclease